MMKEYILPAEQQSPSVDKATAELTPFMRKWTAAERENPDALLFFRMSLHFFQTGSK